MKHLIYLIWLIYGFFNFFIILKQNKIFFIKLLKYNIIFYLFNSYIFSVNTIFGNFGFYSLKNKCNYSHIKILDKSIIIKQSYFVIILISLIILTVVYIFKFFIFYSLKFFYVNYNFTLG